MAAKENILILNQEQIGQKVNRMAYQIYERNFEEQYVVVCGIKDRGYLLARKIFDKLKEIADFELELCAVLVNKDNLQSKDIKIDPYPTDLDKKSVILCDDVLYTGKTLAHAAVPFLESGAKKLQCLVLIQRHHLNFPMQPTYVGMNLATTIQEHISVNLTGTEQVVLG